MPTASAAHAYATTGDAVRERFETDFFASLLRRLLRRPGALLDLGCGDGLAGRLAGGLASRYVGVDLRPPSGDFPGHYVRHDLSDGLGPVGSRGFDVYLASFGLASHMRPEQLALLLNDIGRHGRSGALVALEALGLRSLEWPRLWNVPAGAARTIPYRLAAEVEVHPWLPEELAGLYRDAGIEPLLTLDRTLQAGPKLSGDTRWPGLPALRPALAHLLEGPTARERAAAAAVLAQPLPPLPASPAAALHHELAARRRALVARADLAEAGRLAHEVWRLEPATGGGFGHGLTVIGRIR